MLWAAVHGLDQHARHISIVLFSQARRGTRALQRNVGKSRTDERAHHSVDRWQSPFGGRDQPFRLWDVPSALCYIGQTVLFGDEAADLGDPHVLWFVQVERDREGALAVVEVDPGRVVDCVVVAI